MVALMIAIAGGRLHDPSHHSSRPCAGRPSGHAAACRGPPPNCSLERTACFSTVPSTATSQRRSRAARQVRVQLSPARRRVTITRTAADYEITGSADLPPHLVERAG